MTGPFHIGVAERHLYMRGDRRGAQATIQELTDGRWRISVAIKWTHPGETPAGEWRPIGEAVYPDRATAREQAEGLARDLIAEDQIWSHQVRVGAAH